MRFENLYTQIEKRGIKKSVIAKRLGISERALRNKINCTTPFTWEQTCAIHREFFPDLIKDELFFKVPDSNKAS